MHVCIAYFQNVCTYSWHSIPSSTHIYSCNLFICEHITQLILDMHIFMLRFVIHATTISNWQSCNPQWHFINSYKLSFQLSFIFLEMIVSHTKTMPIMWTIISIMIHIEFFITFISKHFLQLSGKNTFICLLLLSNAWPFVLPCVESFWQYVQYSSHSVYSIILHVQYSMYSMHSMHGMSLIAHVF